MNKDEVNASAGFDDTLKNDEEMCRLKVLLDEAKQSLIDINIEAIKRMRELMAIDSNGRVGTSEDKSQELEEVAKLAISLFDAYKEEAVVEIVEKLVPNWTTVMAESMVDGMIDMLKEVESAIFEDDAANDDTDGDTAA